MPSHEHEHERQTDAKQLAQDLALAGADAIVIREALRERQLDDCLDDQAITHILSEYAVVEQIEAREGSTLLHYFIRAGGVAVALASCVVWYIWGFDVVPFGGIVFGSLLAWAPHLANFEIF